MAALTVKGSSSPRRAVALARHARFEDICWLGKRLFAIGEWQAMREVVRSTDVVFLSWVTAVLHDAGIDAIVLDAYTSVMEGSINAIPRRLMVADEDFEEARRLAEAAETEASASLAAAPADDHADDGVQDGATAGHHA